MLRQKSITVNRSSEKNLKKTNTTHDLHKYKHQHLNPVLTINKEILGNTSRTYVGGKMMEARGLQKHLPYSLFDQVLSAVAISKKENWIVTLPGNRQQRNRDYAKGIYKKQYRLIRHTFGTKLKVEDPSNAGYYKQAWYIGDKVAHEMDVKRARILGPQAYYAPKGLVSHCLKIVEAICRELEHFYSEKYGYSETLNRINQAIYAINIQSQYKFNAYTTRCIENAIKEFVKRGHKNHMQGGCFGRGSGRRTTKPSAKNKRPYNFNAVMCSKPARQVINRMAYRQCQELAIRCTTKVLQRFHIDIRKYYWSDRYIKDYSPDKGASTLDVIEHCLKAISGDLFFMVANTFVHKDVDKYVSNSNKTGHCYSSKRRITNQINISESQSHRPPPKSFKKDLKKEANWNIEDKPKAFRQETGGFIDINEIITKNISIEPDVKEKEIPRVAEDAPNTDIEGPTGSLEVGEVRQPPPTCFEAVEAPVSEIEPAPVRSRPRYVVKDNPYGLSAQEIEAAKSRLMRSFDLMAGKNVEPEPEPVRRRPMTTAEKLRAMGLSDD